MSKSAVERIIEMLPEDQRETARKLLPAEPEKPASVPAPVNGVDMAQLGQFITQTVKEAIAPLEAKAAASEGVAKQVSDQLSAELKRRSESEKAAALDAAQAVGKFTSAQREKWAAAWDKDSETAKALLAEIPENPALANANKGAEKGKAKESKPEQTATTAGAGVTTRASLMEAAAAAFEE